jgi:hypothetical protein
MKIIDGISVFKSKRRPAPGLVLLLTALVPLVLLLDAGCVGENASTAHKPVQQAAIAPRKLSGAELYSMNCNRCHQERYPTERTAAQWRTVLLHMRVRANLPDQQARIILQYLQDNSGR